MYTFYSYWNAEQVRDVLNIIAMIMNGSDYLGLVKAIAIVGLLVAAGTAVVRMRGEEPLGYFIVLAMFYGILFVPKVNVVVQDVRTPTVYNIANVPLGVGFFASEASHVGKWLTETFETTFTPINDEMQFSNTGMVFGAQLIDELQRVEPVSSALRMDLTMFIKDCVNPELVDNPLLVDEMKSQTDLWAWIGGTGSFSLNPGRMTNISDGVGGYTVVMCIDATSTGAYNVLNARITADYTAAVNKIGRKLIPGHPSIQTTIEAAIVGVEGVMMNASRSAADSIRQGVMANLLTRGQATIGAMMNNPTAVQIATADAVAAKQASMQDGIMMQTAQKALPRIRNAIELVVISVFPIVFLLIIAAGIKAGMVFKTYLMTVFWVNLWAPIYAVINYLQTSKDTIDLLAITAGGTNTIENFASVSDVAASSQHIAGMLTLSVPFIAYALVRGGEVAMNSVMSSAMGSASSSAGSASGQAATGNTSAGNYSWGNVSAGNYSGGNWSSGNSSWNNASANKDDRSQAKTDPGMTSHTTPWGSYQTDGKGNVTGMQAARWDVGGSAGGSTNLGRGDNNVSGAGVRAADGRSSSMDLVTAATSSDRLGASTSRAVLTAIASKIGTSQSFGRSSSAGTGSIASTEQGTSSQLQNSENGQFGSNIGMDAGAGATQQYGPYGGPAGGAPGGGGQGGGHGGAAPGGSQGGSAAAPRSGGSSANLPVPYGQNPTGGSKAGPVMGSRKGNIGGGFGMSYQNAQSVVDAATNRSGAVDQKTQQEAANIVRSAISDLMKNTSDGQTKAALKDFSANFENAVRSGMQYSASVTNENSAGNQRSQGTNNSVGGSYNMGQPVAQQLLQMAGGDPVKALQMAANPQAVAQATLAAAQEMQGSGAGQSTLGAGGARAPESPSSVAAAGNGKVDGLRATGMKAATKANNQNRTKAAGQQVANPDSAPNTAPAVNQHNSGAAAVQAAYQQFSGDTGVAMGAQAAANAFYQADQKGAGTILGNALGFGAGYKSGEEYRSAVMAAAASNPRLADTLRNIGSKGGHVSPQAMEYIRGEMQKHEAAQPGFFSSLLN